MDDEKGDAEMTPEEWAAQAEKLHAALQHLPPLPVVKTSSLDRTHGPARRPPRQA